MYLIKVKGKINMKILLVEDEIDLNNIVTKYLKKNGYSVDSVPLHFQQPLRSVQVLRQIVLPFDEA